MQRFMFFLLQKLRNIGYHFGFRLFLRKGLS